MIVQRTPLSLKCLYKITDPPTLRRRPLLHLRSMTPRSSALQVVDLLQNTPHSSLVFEQASNDIWMSWDSRTPCVGLPVSKCNENGAMCGILLWRSPFHLDRQSSPVVTSSFSAAVTTWAANTVKIFSSTSGVCPSWGSSTNRSMIGILSSGALTTFSEAAFLVFWSSIGVSSKNEQQSLRYTR